LGILIFLTIILLLSPGVVLEVLLFGCMRAFSFLLFAAILPLFLSLKTVLFPGKRFLCARKWIAFACVFFFSVRNFFPGCRRSPPPTPLKSTALRVQLSFRFSLFPAENFPPSFEARRRPAQQSSLCAAASVLQPTAIQCFGPLLSPPGDRPPEPPMRSSPPSCHKSTGSAVFLPPFLHYLARA